MRTQNHMLHKEVHIKCPPEGDALSSSERRACCPFEGSVLREDMMGCTIWETLSCTPGNLLRRRLEENIT